ncbi:hypothetical protein LUZ60_009241 [Juncus effusus]|nr:hypothetical protein LUZ60_009241 [Juncus effusus]
MGLSLFHSTPPPKCSSNNCSEWARTYLKYCLCSTKDGFALGLGLISVFSWGIAEVPQIMTNFKNKSTEGLSVTFLITWLVGDLFNLIGCFLEPATLPTQFYMALLYTITTILLAWQAAYYGHLNRKLKSKGKSETQTSEENKVTKEEKEYLEGINDYKKNENKESSTIPVLIPRHGSNEDVVDLYYTSARSLSRSPIPIVGSQWINNSRIISSSLTNDQNEPLLSSRSTMQSAPTNRTLLSVVPITSFIIVNMILQSQARNRNSFSQNFDGKIFPIGRKLLNLEGKMVNSDGGDLASGVGTILGWAMAAIYMGGRLPQIFLNMKRGNVEGLNPLMFTFALVGNATYVGSILVNSLEWAKIRPNLPWLVDAAGCVVLDSFIMLQFAYFHLRSRKASQNRDS